MTAPFRSIRRKAKSVKEFFSQDPEEVPVADAFSHALENPESLLTHFEELRRRIFSALIALAITTGVSFFFVNQILEYLTRPIGGLSTLQAIEVTEPVGVFMRVALLSGVALAFPWIAYQMYAFVAPGLKVRSRLTLLIAIPFATLLFLTGMAFTYFIMLPAALPFLSTILGVRFSPRPASYIGFVTSLMFWVGVAFQLPLVVYALAAAGLVRAKALAEQWRLAIIGIAVLAAAVTPTIDPVNMALVMAPMIALYFLSIGLAVLAERGRKSRAG